MFLFHQDKFRLNSAASRWLDEEGGGGSLDRDFDRWLYSVECAAETIRLGRILVDAQVWRTRFSCQPEKCAPWAGPDRWLCCCADVVVTLEASERKRLERHRAALQELVRREHGSASARSLFAGDGALRRPQGRCVFSTRDRRGRIRCLLYRAAGREQVDIRRLQPFSCRLFPLVLVRLDRRRVLLSVLNEENFRCLRALPPQRLGCLSTGPRLVKSLASVLDWLFGPGFARLLIGLRPS